MCTIWNLYHGVLSFRLPTLPLEISSRDWSLNILRSGLWSTVMMRSLQPRTKNRAVSGASATARAFPSIGAWCDSAVWVHRFTTSAIFQPVGQQKGFLDAHWQCFWKSQNPIPLFDQSVARQVGLDLSNMWTPFSISLTITALDSSKSWLSVSSQWSGVPGLSNR